MQRGHAHGALQPTCRGWLGEKAHVSHKRSVVRLNDGASAARASTRWLEHASQYSSLRRSVDGRTWADEEEVLPGTMGGLVQPTMVRTPHGSLRCFFRSRAADCVYAADSTDDGHSW